MPASVEQLRTVPTSNQVLQWYLGQLSALGFNTGGWVDGTPQRKFLLALSRVTTNFAEMPKQLVELCVNDLARGAALEAYSISRFGNTPKPGTKATHSVTLTNSGTVPHTVVVGALRLATKQNVQFQNLTGGTVPAGGTLVITVEALKKGTGGNVADGTITVLTTPLAGVSATNTLLTSGEDPELDSALRLRNSTKWARLSIEMVRDAYINIALESSANIRRAEVDDTNPRGAGTIDVYIAGGAGTAGPDDVRDCQNFFATHALQTETYPADPTPAPANANPTRVLVLAAPALTINVTGTVYYQSSYSVLDIQAKVEAAIDAYIGLAPIGGYPYPSPGKVIPKNNLENAIIKVTGVRTVSLTDPAADVALPGFNVARVGVKNLTYQAVA